MKASKFVGILTILIGGAIAIGPWTFVRVCGNMSESDPMCHKTRLIALGIGAIIVLLGIIMFLLRNKIAAGLFSVLLAAGGVATILLPIIIAPVCGDNTMHCRTHTMPFLLVIGCVLTVVGILSMVYMFKSRKPKDFLKECPAQPVNPQRPRPEEIPARFDDEDHDRPVQNDWPDQR